MLEARGRMDEAVVLSRQAIQIEPCDESLYYHLMRQLLELGNQQAAASVYESMSEMLFDRFGVMPSEEIKALYREALHSSNQKEIDISSLREQLREPSCRARCSAVRLRAFQGHLPSGGPQCGPQRRSCPHRSFDG